VAREGVDVWLECEADSDLDPGNASSRVLITLARGEEYALSVWTFGFLQSFLADSRELGLNLGGVYVVAPDLLVERLDRPTIERVVADLVAEKKLDLGWRGVDEVYGLQFKRRFAGGSERPEGLAVDEFVGCGFRRLEWAPDWFAVVPPVLMAGACTYIRNDGMVVTVSSNDLGARPKDIRAVIEEIGATASAEQIEEEIHRRTSEWLESARETGWDEQELYPDDGIF
jgi:hypothetical protein